MKHLISKLIAVEKQLVKISSKGWSAKDMTYEETRRGVAWGCKIIKDGKSVGRCENRGDGGANLYYFTDKEAEKEFHVLANKKYPHASEPESNFMEELVAPLEGR
jgi:hypothetical protein